MDSMSGRARLARNNINILGITAPTPNGHVYVVYEFQYRLPTATRSTVWRKTFGWYDSSEAGIIDGILNDVRALRRELENDESHNQD